MNLFMFMSPQQIYEDLTGGPGSDTLGAAQKLSNDETEREFVRAAQIQRMGKTIYDGWQGSAADAASGAASPLMRAASDGSQHLHRAQDLLSRQSGSFHEAANSVVPMPEKPPEVGMLDEMLPTESDTEKAVKQYQADAYHNIQVFQGYDDASAYNEDMPRDYTLTNHSGGTLSVTDGGGDSGAVDSDDSGQPRGPGNYSAPGGGDVGGTPSGSPSPGPAGGGPLPGGGSQTNPSEYRPSPTPGYSPGGYPESPAAHQPSSGGPGIAPGTVGGYPGGGSGGGWRGGGAGGPGGAGGSGAGAPGAGRAPGPSAGVGALAAAEEAAARRGAAGAAGARGAFGPMAAPMGAGRGRDEDEEHTRKVLIEADAEGTFGSDVMTAPPVIGDEEDED